MEQLDHIAREFSRLGPGVALTGAGISAESGILTYRDNGGLWDKYPKGADSGMLGVLAAYPDKAPEILGAFFEKLENARPNSGHMALAEMEERGLISGVITQNVDDLHKQAGSRKVFELHGNIFRFRCTSCGLKTLSARDSFFRMARQMVDNIRAFSLAAISNVLPKCECGGTMRPDFVGFGEPVQDLEPATRAASSLDFMLVCGTSGVVHPAASLPLFARKNGAFLVEVNPKKSALTDIMDVFIQGTAGEILPRLLEKLKNTGLSGDGAA